MRGLYLLFDWIGSRRPQIVDNKVLSAFSFFVRIHNFRDMPQTNIIKLEKLTEMKRLFLALALMTCSYALAFTSDNQAYANPEMQQDQFVNVSAEVGDDGRVVLRNRSDFDVNVNYTVTALNKGVTIELNNGVIYLKAGGSACFDTTPGYTGYSISVSVQRCS